MSTLDFIERIASVVAGIIVLLVFLVAGFMVIRDGNTPDVVSLENDIVTAIQWIGSLTAILILGRLGLDKIPPQRK